MLDAQRLPSVDLFSGAGGLSLGLEAAGFHVAFALDHDRHACTSYRHHFGSIVHEATLDAFPPERICENTGISLGDYALVCGGPPCQGFSLQRRGKRDDSRNFLVHQFASTAVALRPLMILMENVPALLGSRGSSYLADVRDVLQRGGYDHRAAVLDAADFGVPQHRERAFLVAWRIDTIRGFRFPPPTHNSGNYRTVATALSDLPEPPTDFSEPPEFFNHVRVRMSAANLRRIAHVPQGGGRKDIPLDLQLPCHRNDNGHRHLNVFGHMKWSDPAPTITAMFDNFTRGRFAHPNRDRSITGREGARLQSFPDSFRFFGGKKDVARQIGNAVPPLLAEKLGLALKAAIRGELRLDDDAPQGMLFTSTR